MTIYYIEAHEGEFYAKGDEITSGEVLYDRYRDYLDESYGKMNICGMTFYPSQIFEKFEREKFERGFDDWTNAEGWVKLGSYDDRVVLCPGCTMNIVKAAAEHGVMRANREVHFDH